MLIGVFQYPLLDRSVIRSISYDFGAKFTPVSVSTTGSFGNPAFFCSPPFW